MLDPLAGTGSADPLDLRGVVPPTLAVFDEGELDPTATAAHARFVVSRGVHGVFPLGTNGEAPLLAPDERARVVEAVADEVGSEVPVIAGVGVESTRETVRNARRAAAAGADGIVAVTPYYYPLSADGAVEYFSAVASATDLPTYVYHIPSKTGNALSLETLDRVAAVDGIAGVKDSSKDVPWLGQAVDAHPDLTFLGGSDSLLYTSLDIGCSGVVSAVANAFPEAVVELYEAYRDGDEARARALQSEIFAVRRALKGGPYMAGVKAALSLREDVPFDPGTTRSPLQPMSDEETTRLKSRLDELEYL